MRYTLKRVLGVWDAGGIFAVKKRKI
jgi:hypothetical protein